MEGHRAGGQEGQRGLDVQDFPPARDSGHRSPRQAVWRGRGEARQTRRRSSPDRQERQNDDSQNFLRRRRKRLREGRRAARNLQSRKIAARRIELQSRRSGQLGSGEWGVGSGNGIFSPFPITHYPLLITHYPLPIPHSPLPTPHSLLLPPTSTFKATTIDN